MVWQVYFQMKNFDSEGTYYENYVSSAKLVDKGEEFSVGHVSRDNHFDTFTCGPEDLGEIGDRTFYGVMGSRHSCGFWDGLLFFNQINPPPNMGYTALFERYFRDWVDPK